MEPDLELQGLEQPDDLTEAQPETQVAPPTFTPPAPDPRLDALERATMALLEAQQRNNAPQEPVFNADEMVTNLISNPAQGFEQLMAAAEARVMAKLAPQLNAAGNISVVDRATSQEVQARYNATPAQMVQLEQTRAGLMVELQRINPNALANPQQAATMMRNALDTWAFQNGIGMKPGGGTTMSPQARPTGGPAPTGGQTGPAPKLTQAQLEVALNMPGKDRAEKIANYVKFGTR